MSRYEVTIREPNENRTHIASVDVDNSDTAFEAGLQSIFGADAEWRGDIRYGFDFGWAYRGDTKLTGWAHFTIR